MEIGMSPWSKVIALLIALLMPTLKEKSPSTQTRRLPSRRAATLSCRVPTTARPTGTITRWCSGGKLKRIFIRNGNEVNNHPRVQWTGNQAACNASIVMREVLLEDSAQYRCEVFRIPSYEGRSVVELHTLPSKDLIIYAPTEETTNVGNDVLLKCSFFCKGPRDKSTLVQWWRIRDGRDEKIFTKNGQDHVVDSRFAWRGNETSCDASISIKNASLSDAAQYRCEVIYIPSYKQGRKVMRLNVQAPPDTPCQTTPRINPANNCSFQDRNILIAVIVVLVVLLVIVSFLGLRYGTCVSQRCRRCRLDRPGFHLRTAACVVAETSQRREQRNNTDPPGNGGRNEEVPEGIPLQLRPSSEAPGNGGRNEEVPEGIPLQLRPSSEGAESQRVELMSANTEKEEATSWRVWGGLPTCPDQQGEV
ncbi:uncharacterized protein LOC144719635 isoform X2 [Lampetra planeri]